MSFIFVFAGIRFTLFLFRSKIYFLHLYFVKMQHMRIAIVI